jgi:transcriptional regulator with PAS, ATPase and Fis domain
MENKAERIIEIASLLNHQVDWNEMLRLINTKTQELFNCGLVKISIFNPLTQNTIKTISENEKNFSPSCLKMVTIHISGWLLLNRKSFFSNNLPQDERFNKGQLENCKTNSAIGTLLVTNNQPFGMMLLLNKNNTEGFTEVDVKLAEDLSEIISPFIHRIEEINKYFNGNLTQNELLNKYSKFGLIGKSDVFIDLLKAVDSAANCDVRVLLEGETGTGKEVVAKAIHKASILSDKKFVVADCASIPENLIESELFGHTKGAFTGAVKDKRGLIEEAEGGTLFIDEINNLQRDLQIKFLRFLQEKEFRSIGANQVKKSNVRIIVASSVKLSKLVKEQKMREELFYRLNVYPIYIPNLNDRCEDIMLLAHHFERKFAIQQNKIVETFDTEIMEYLIHRHWAGNIRELENFIERIVTLAPSNEKIIYRNSLPAEHLDELQNVKNQRMNFGSQFSLTDKMSEIEVQLIREALVHHNWNQSKAAFSLKIPEQTLRYKMHKFHIEKSEN